MAEIIKNENGAAKKGKRRAKRHTMIIDMTPMVDLACLLLTFFMLTTAFSKPKVLEITLPETEGEPRPIPKNRVINIILDGNDRIFYYNGLADPFKLPLPNVYQSEFGVNGIRKVLLLRNKNLFKKIEKLNSDVSEGNQVITQEALTLKLKEMKIEDSLGPIVLIKATNKAKYKNIVDIANEMAITNIARYSITDLNTFEEKLLAKTKREMGLKE